MKRMTFAYLACLAFAGGLGAWYAVRRYKSMGPRERKRMRRVAEEPEYNDAIAKQLA